jgi:U-box domain
MNAATPSEFLCPITMELMVHPMATRHGQNFEKSAIVAWLRQGSGACPLTRKPLKISDLIHNHGLAAEIQLWRNVHGIPSGSDEKFDDDRATVEQSLRHIYGTSAFPFNAVTPALDYARAGSTNTLTTARPSSRLSPRRKLRAIACTPMQSLRHKSTKMFGFCSVKA